MKEFLDIDIYNIMNDMQNTNPYITMLERGSSFLNGTSLDKRIKASLRFSSKRMSLEEIDSILLHATHNVINKLFHYDSEPFSLRDILEDAVKSPILYETAVNNISYGILSTISDFVLASMQFYYRREALFFYVRDSIVEPNYRNIIMEIKNNYSKLDSITIDQNKIMEFTDKTLKLIKNILIMPTHDIDSILKLIDDIRPMLDNIDLDSRRFAINNSTKYPIPDFLSDILVEGMSTDVPKYREFLNKLNTTFTKKGLRELYLQFSPKSIQNSSFDIQLSNLYSDRSMYNSLAKPIDGLTFNENKILEKIVKRQSLIDIELDIIQNNDILKKINEIINRFPNDGLEITYDDKDLYIKHLGKTTTYNYIGIKDIKADLDSPFNLFADKYTMIKDIANNEPNKLCSNQAILKKQSMVDVLNNMSSPEPKTLQEKKSYNIRRRNEILAKHKFLNDPEFSALYYSLLKGEFNEIKYLRPFNFTNYIIEDDKIALLTIAEAIGFNQKLEEYRRKEK